MKRHIKILILGFLLMPALLPTQEKTADIDWYKQEAETAIDKENYEYAVKILEKGKKLYPESAELSIQLADLYFDKKLYQLSLDEYLAADKKSPDRFNTLDRIQTCYGFLNENEFSIKYLKRILDLYPLDENPDSYYAVHDLGWMYYKTHRLEAGETLILESLETSVEREHTRSLLMTLATIYSGMYEYTLSRDYYLEAAKDALEDKDTYFTAICYYNLALLEYTFYNFNSAMQYTNESLKQADRPTGHLSRGELLQLQMNYKEALAEYEKGQDKEETPLTSINMAILYNKFGLLEAARQYAEQVYSSRDLSWIMNFGTDKERHQMEMHELFADIYGGLARREKLLPQPHFFAEIQSFFIARWYDLNEYYHRQLFKSYSIKIGKSYLKEQNWLDAYWQFFQGNTGYKDIALKYLSKAKELETAVAPHASVYYLMEEGRLRKSEKLLKEALSKFDPYWEKEAIFNSLILLIPLKAKASREKRELLNRAYAINPGGLFAAGCGIPLEVELNLTGKARQQYSRILALLKKAGSEIKISAGQDLLPAGFKYKLTLFWLDPGESGFTLTDNASGAGLLSRTLEPGTGNYTNRCVRIIRTLLINHLYAPPEK